VTLSHLAPVLETLEWLAREGKVWTEVTNLVIPGLNDDPDETRRLAEWIGARMGPDVPLHFSAFHPAWKMMDRPRTPPATLTRARQIARQAGLRHVYTGNVHDPTARPPPAHAAARRCWCGTGTTCSGTGSGRAGRAGTAGSGSPGASRTRATRPRREGAWGRWWCSRHRRPASGTRGRSSPCPGRC